MQTIQTDNSLAIDSILLGKAALIFRAVNHHLRQRILKLLHSHQKMSVTTLYVKLGLEQSVASLHLAILRKEGFVTAEKVGNQVFYSVNHERLNLVGTCAKALNQRN